jgi:hypothetical protein
MQAGMAAVKVRAIGRSTKSYDCGLVTRTSLLTVGKAVTPLIKRFSYDDEITN